MAEENILGKFLVDKPEQASIDGFKSSTWYKFTHYVAKNIIPNYETWAHSVNRDNFDDPLFRIRVRDCAELLYEIHERTLLTNYDANKKLLSSNDNFTRLSVLLNT